MVGHTHDNIDVSFGCWSMKLHEEDFPTILLLIKLYMDLNIVPIMAHLIEEFPNFKAIIKPFILKGGDCLAGYAKAQQFCFYMCDNGILTMQFNILCTSTNWGLEDGILHCCQMNMENVCYHMES